MKTIPLSQGMFALVDDEDYDEISQWQWYARKTRNTYYAVRNIRASTLSKGGCVYMHRQILNTTKGSHTDHRDGNGMNNQRSNIRICTPRQNWQAHRKLRSNKAAPYRGVSKKRDKFRARIVVNSAEISLGSFATIDEAARAYDEAALLFFGEFASLNFK